MCSGDPQDGKAENGIITNDYKYGRFDHTALHIAHALNATKIQMNYRVLDKPINAFLVSIFNTLMLFWLILDQRKTNLVVFL